jgi:FtsH-binding integral membrane protein
MDTQTTEVFRLKFYKLALQLNAVILLAALTVMAVFIAPEPYRIPLVLAMTALVAYLAITFRKKYRQTRAWLYDHVESGKGSEPQK